MGVRTMPWNLCIDGGPALRTNAHPAGDAAEDGAPLPIELAWDGQGELLLHLVGIQPITPGVS